VCSEVAALQAARISEDRRGYLWLEVIGAVLIQSQDLFLKVVADMEQAKVGLLGSWQWGKARAVTGRLLLPAAVAAHRQQR
jgi:hypothetical protein